MVVWVNISVVGVGLVLGCFSCQTSIHFKQSSTKKVEPPINKPAKFAAMPTTFEASINAKPMTKGSHSCHSPYLPCLNARSNRNDDVINNNSQTIKRKYSSPPVAPAYLSSCNEWAADVIIIHISMIKLTVKRRKLVILCFV